LEGRSEEAAVDLMEQMLESETLVADPAADW
jgi:hypothetical protein